MRCPSCGHEIEENADVIIDEEACLVTGNGKYTKLTPREMEIIILLKNAYPRVLSNSYICDSLYPHESDRAEEKIVDVFVCKIRAKLKGIGLSIITSWGQGYKLAYGSEAEDEQEHSKSRPKTKPEVAAD